MPGRLGTLPQDYGPLPGDDEQSKCIKVGQLLQVDI